MKVTVIKENESVIYNGEIYRHGESFEVEDAIGESLMDRGYVSEDFPVAEDEAEEQEAAVESGELGEMSYADLKSLAAQLGLDAKGRKDELIERIRAHAENRPDEDAADLNDADESADELPNTDMPE